MLIRQMLEKQEHEILSPYAAFSDNSMGRDIEEKPCDIRPVYQRDRDRILHCKSFRRLKQKTQVFLAPEGDHYRTRLTHTLEVSQNARTIAKALRLNEDLTEAIALGHDLGHTPFGHSGEAVLDEFFDEGFAHQLQSLRVVEVLENEGRGLNLTKEVRDGILNHQTKGKPMTLEGQIVRLSDKIAYVNHDIDDAIRAKVLNENEIPSGYTDVLGDSVKKRLDNIIHDIVSNSIDKPCVCLSDEFNEALFGIRQFMFEHVYKNPVAKAEEKKAQDMIRRLLEHYLTHPDSLPDTYLAGMEKRHESIERTVIDYVAGMTDQYAINRFTEIYVPRKWEV